MPIIFATRPSALARWQTQWVIQELQKAWPGLECQEKIITTQGDRILDRPLPEIGGKGLFTQELEAEILSGQVQAAVHSLKDLPTDLSPDLPVGAIPRRAEVRDALISAQGYTLDRLPEGARVGTSSLRRSAQLLAYRPDLRVESLRGNVDTRVRKAQRGDYDAVLIAGAGLIRLGLEDQITQWLPLEVMLPAPGQGALAVQCRAGDVNTLKYLAAIDDPAARKTTTAERTFLSELGGGCSVPVAAYAGLNGDQIEMNSLVASLDGKQVIRCRGWNGDPSELGRESAAQVLAEGADHILEAVLSGG